MNGTLDVEKEARRAVRKAKINADAMVVGKRKAEVAQLDGSMISTPLNGTSNRSGG
jgi:hypothetical protein